MRQTYVNKSRGHGRWFPAFAGMTFAYVFILSIFYMGLLSTAIADPTFPELSGRVVDGAGMLDAEDTRYIEQQLAQLEEKSSDQLVVVTLPGLQGYSIEDFGVRLARHWQIGQKDTNNGVLLIIAPKDRKVRIEVGYGLEGTLTDTLAGNIVHNRILPMFRKGKMSEGIKRGVDDIIDTLSGDAAGVAERAKAGRRNSGDGFEKFLVLIIWGFMFFGMMGKSVFGSWSRRGGIIIVPVGEASSHWHSGGFGGGGGGFSGGGGSFGGGGASGGW